ncbi:MAG: hypothetical protein QM784_36065 [Polyangiaceae bacterium]
MNASSNPRPVLLPLGWPADVSEREALTRVLLAAGADIERLLDAPSNPNAFVRHATRLPFLRGGRELPLVAFAPGNDDVDALLRFREMLLDSVSALRETTWLVYVEARIRPSFIKAAQPYGCFTDAGGGLFTWHVPYGTMGITSRDTWVAGLAARLEELLAPTPESGIMPVDPPVGEFRHRSVATTEPAAPYESPSDNLMESPYAAIAGRSMNPSALSAPPPFQPGFSSMPPNPRLRKR